MLTDAGSIELSWLVELVVLTGWTVEQQLIALAYGGRHINLYFWTLYKIYIRTSVNCREQNNKNMINYDSRIYL